MMPLREGIDRLLAVRDDVSAWECEFLCSVASQETRGWHLTEKQLAVLQRMVNRYLPPLPTQEEEPKREPPKEGLPKEPVQLAEVRKKRARRTDKGGLH
jgi:hypothetical protein